MNFAENILNLQKKSTDELLNECIDRLNPILTHKRKPSSMSVPVDFERDDDVYVIERLREIKRRPTDKDSP